QSETRGPASKVCSQITSFSNGSLRASTQICSPVTSPHPPKCGTAERPSRAVARALVTRARKAASAADAVADVRRQRRVDDLDRLEAGIGDAVEEPLTGAEQDGDEVEGELVDHACHERLAHGRRAAGDVDSAITCGLRGARECGVEAVADEIER